LVIGIGTGAAQLSSISATKFIQELCKSLESVALTHFMHDITFAHGQISMLVREKDIFLFYYQNQIPTLCTDATGRTLANGIYLNKTLENSRRDCSILMPLMVKIGRRFGQHYGQNALSIVVRENDCQHLYSLFFDLAEKEFLHWVINNGNYLKDFIDSYNVAANDLILEAKAEENRIILPTFNDLGLAIHADDANEEKRRLCLFHKNMHMPIHLSIQQSKCLILLSRGKSAKEIALEMKLSYRTVEHYLEKIREQLGCSSNREVIAAYGNQLLNASLEK
jgi:DNA-binding CsgD family transcriptional regulator